MRLAAIDPTNAPNNPIIASDGISRRKRTKPKTTIKARVDMTRRVLLNSFDAQLSSSELTSELSYFLSENYTANSIVNGMLRIDSCALSMRLCILFLDQPDHGRLAFKRILNNGCILRRTRKRQVGSKRLSRDVILVRLHRGP